MFGKVSGRVAGDVHAADRVLGAHIFVGRRLELATTRGAAEMEQAAAMFARRLAGSGIDGHAADGVANHRFGRRAVTVAVVGVSGVIFSMFHLKKSSICSGMGQ